jgi:hypothetical protein
LAELGKELGRIGPIGIEEAEQIATGDAESGLECSTISPVARVGNAENVSITSRYLGSLIAGTIIDDYEFKILNPDLFKPRPNGEDALDYLGNAILLVEGRDNH